MPMKYISALTRYDHAATIIDGYRPPILPENIGKVHAVHDEYRDPLIEPSNTPTVWHNPDHTADLEALWETKKPVFHEESTADYRMSACGIYVKVLLPMDFSTDDPDACRLCVKHLERDS